MGSCGASRGTDIADDVATLDSAARPHRELREVAVSRDQPESVIDDHEIAVIAARRRQLNLAGCRRHDGRSSVCGDVETGMEIAVARERIRAHAVACREPSVNGPD